eukprot:scaffold108018_cov51-Phaeocystis_antarctica.AAC.1
MGQMRQVRGRPEGAVVAEAQRWSSGGVLRCSECRSARGAEVQRVQRCKGVPGAAAIDPREIGRRGGHGAPSWSWTELAKAGSGGPGRASWARCPSQRWRCPAWS